MDHKEAVRTMAVEKYLLNEFAPEQRDEFEEHYFSCHECAQDIAAGAALLEHGKQFFARERAEESRQPQRVVVLAKPSRTDWFAWLRPAFAVPAMALLLFVVGFQNLVQVPRLEKSLTAMNTPELLPSSYLASGSARGGERHAVTARPNQSYVLVIDIPGASDAAYVAELYDAAGQKKWSLDIPKDEPKESLSLQVPSGNDQPGDYTLVVRETNPSGAASAEARKYDFELKRP